MDRPGIIRRLWMNERDQVRDHLLRLEPDDRRLRFGGHTSEARIAAYSDDLDWSRAVMIGHQVDSAVRGLGEFKPYGEPWARAAEVALSVERPFQNRGVGTELLGRLIVAARNRSIRTLAMICLPENSKMLRVARKLGAKLEFRDGEVDARLALLWPNHTTLLLELIDDVGAILGVAPSWAAARADAATAPARPREAALGEVGPMA